MNLKKICAITVTVALLGTYSVSMADNYVSENLLTANEGRKLEELNRGLVAMETDNGVFLSWRLMNDEDTRFGTAENEVTFDLYRDGVKIADVDKTTNYTDTEGTAESEYYVVSSTGEQSETASAFTTGQNYFDISLERPNESPYGSYTINDCSTGDLDGDGEYEIVVKWDSNGKDNSQSGTTGDVLLDAYKLNGERLWDTPINLGKNIRAGAHYTQFLVYDFDKDGNAEITCKTAPGSKDGRGEYVTAASENAEIVATDNNADYRNGGGYILEGDEFFTVFNGETGAAEDTIYYPVQRVSAAVWGDTYGNRCDRYIADVSYLDGANPYAVYWRGYYYGAGSQRTGICAIRFDGERLITDYCFDTYDTSGIENYKGVHGYTDGNGQYVGQGNHNMTTADVDGDGKDEFISGSLCMEVKDDNKLGVKWCSFRQHGDALHIGAYDPTRNGYVYFSVHEDGGTNPQGKVLDYGMTLYDAATGEELFHKGANDDTGRGMMANVGAGGYYQFWGSGMYKALGNENYAATSILGTSSNFRIFWDGDFYDELLDGTGITAWNGAGMENIFSAQDVTAVNGSKNNPSLQADILGDWREEVIYAKRDNAGLRVYVSDIPTNYKIKTLMHDSVYRSGVASEQSAYNQPPHIGFFMDETSFSGPVTALNIVSVPSKTKYAVGDSLETKGLRVAAVYQNGKTEEIKDFIVEGYDPNNGGKQNITVSYGGTETSFEVEVACGFRINSDGIITGFEPYDESVVVLPEKVDNITVKGFDDEALKNSDITDIYIYNKTLSFGSDVFPNTVTVHSYDDATVKAYCESNGIPFSTINTNFSYMADVNYDSSDYESYVGNFIVTQANTLVSKSIDGITYGDNPRADSYPDATTGIRIGTEGDNNYLIPVAGEFSTSGRNSWISVDNKVDLNTVSEYTVKFDVMYPTNCGTLVFTLSDGSGNIVDSFEYTNDMELDTWYTYTYTYDSNKNLTRKVTQGSTLVGEKNLGTASGTYGINKIDFTRNENGANPSTLWGGWGNHGMGRCAQAYMDNIKVFTPALAAAQFTVTDKYGCPIEGATVTMALISQMTDNNGQTAITAENGKYTATVTAEGFESATAEVLLRDGNENIAVTLTDAPPHIDSFVMDDSLTMKIGDSGYIYREILPVKAETDIRFSSENTAVATVNSKGNVVALSEGTNRITAVCNGEEKQCDITVIANDYTPVVSKIELIGQNNISSVLWSSGGADSVTARVFDQNGALMSNRDITYTCENATLKKTDVGVNVEPDKYFSGTLVLRADLEGVSVTKNITVTAQEYSTYAESELDSTMRLTQGKEIQTAAGDRGITYVVGGRGSGGDGYTGFEVKGGKLYARAGTYNTSSRNAYITFDNAPAMTGSNDYMLRMNITFTSGNANVTIGDGANPIVSLSKDKGFEQNTEYEYILLYRGGEFSQIVTNTATKESTSSKIYSSSNKIGRIDITNDKGEKSEAVLDNIILSSANRIMTTAIVSLIDSNGAPISGAEVKSDLTDAVTMANGKASVKCFMGLNTIVADGVVYYADITKNMQNVTFTVSSDITVAYDNGLKIESDKSCDAAVIVAKYDGNVLQSTEINNISINEGSNIYDIKASNGDKIMLWDSVEGMKPLSRVYTVNQ